MALADLRKRAVLLSFSLAFSAAIRAAEPRPAEYEIKAAFLFNFAKFVEWPPGAFPGRETPFNVCLLGEGPFIPQLSATLEGKTVHDRALAVREIRRVEDAGGCQLLFVGPSEGLRVGHILAAVKGAPMLTVGDVDGFARRGGMIGFTWEDKKVRFSINPGSASASGLKVSSQLLKLARIVE